MAMLRIRLNHPLGQFVDGRFALTFIDALDLEDAVATERKSDTHLRVRKECNASCCDRHVPPKFERPARDLLRVPPLLRQLLVEAISCKQFAVSSRWLMGQ